MKNSNLFINAGKVALVALTVGLTQVPCATTVMADEIPTFGWYEEAGKQYWYEDGTRQGTYDDANGVMGDGTIRGREIYDPVSDGWYWLDAVYNGAKAVNKEVWMPYIYQNEAEWGADEIAMNASNSGDMKEQVIREINNKSGKWVRYDANGKMYKGWYTVEGADAEIYPTQAGNTYYYDPMTGLMAKGYVSIDGTTYYFDEVTGVLNKENSFEQGEVIIASGEYNGADWLVTNTGKMVLNGAFDYTYDDTEKYPTIYAFVIDMYKNAPWKEYASEVVDMKISIDEFYGYELFRPFSKLQTLDISGCGYADLSMSWFNSFTKELVSVNMSNTTINPDGDMFKGLSKLTSVDMSNSTIEGYLGFAFTDCSNLVLVNLKGVDTSGVTDMQRMFKGCSSLVELDLSDLDTENVDCMLDMFTDCSSLVSLDLSNFKTEKNARIDGMFDGCSSLVSLNLKNFSTSDITDFRVVFKGCSSLTELDLSSFDMRQAYSAVNMFENCTNLKTIYVGENWVIPESCYINNMFLNCGTDVVTYK